MSDAQLRKVLKFNHLRLWPDRQAFRLANSASTISSTSRQSPDCVSVATPGFVPSWARFLRLFSLSLAIGEMSDSMAKPESDLSKQTP
jgi:hypothetical protein